MGQQLDSIDRFYSAQSDLEVRPVGKGKAAVVVGNVSAGDRDVWAASPGGTMAPARLTVGTWPTHTEVEPNATVAQAQEVVLPTVVCGRIEPGTDVDWYRVQLQAGDGLTLSCRSTTLGGTLQPTIIVVDPSGREVAHDSLLQLEPAVHVEAKESGIYAICVQDRSYRTTPAPFYQLSLTTGPWIVGAYPPTVEKGTYHVIQLYGYRLPSGEALAGDGSLQRQTAERTMPNSIPTVGQGWMLTRSLFIDALEFQFSPEAGGVARFEVLNRAVQDSPAETSGGDSKSATLRELPFDVVNQFASPREVVHWYRFRAQAGRTYSLEAVAERIDRTCDLELIVHDGAGKILESIGNYTTPKDLATELTMDSRDPIGTWKAPADGEYLLAVRDLLGTAMPTVERAYRLSVGLRPEEVRVVVQLDAGGAANGWTVKAGGTLNLSLVALRRGGHEAPIEVRAEALPPGVTIAPVTIAAKQATGVLKISADKSAAAWIGAIRLTAATQADGKPTTMEVRAVARSTPAVPGGARVYGEPVIAIAPIGKK